MAPDEETTGPTPAAIIEGPRTPGPYVYHDELRRVDNLMNRNFADDLRATVEQASRSLEAMPAEAATRRPSPEKWSPIEILGHLIDSASNNHQRFVRAQFREDLRFDGYAQDAWVSAQAYQSASWPEVVSLWRSFNLHLAHVMERTPGAELERLRTDHNLDQLAWEVVSRDEATTLEYFMRDYVGHLKHHLQQIDPKLSDAPRRQRESSVLKTM